MALHRGELLVTDWLTVDDAALAELLGAAAGPTRPALVLVDGGSGTGKTTAATRIAQVLDAPLVHTDDIAWHLDPIAWDDVLIEHVITPWRAGRGCGTDPMRGSIGPAMARSRCLRQHRGWSWRAWVPPEPRWPSWPRSSSGCRPTEPWRGNAASCATSRWVGRDLRPRSSGTPGICMSFPSLSRKSLGRERISSWTAYPIRKRPERCGFMSLRVGSDGERASEAAVQRPDRRGGFD